MLRLLIDTDMLLEALLNRVNSPKEAFELWEVLKFQYIQGAITDLGLEKICLFLTRFKGAEIAEEVIHVLRELVIVLRTDCHILNEARALPSKDFESAVELVCAVKYDCWALVTHLSENFSALDLQILTLDRIVERHRLEEVLQEGTLPSMLVGDLQLIRQLEKIYAGTEHDKTTTLLDNEGKLSYIDLSYSDFSSGNLSGLDFRGSNISFSQLIESNFNKSNLSRAKIVSSDLTEADLSEALLYRTNLFQAHLYKANLSQSCLDYAKLDGANLTRANLTRASLSGASLLCIKMNGANLRNATLRHAFLLNSEATHSSFCDTDLLGIGLSGSNLRYSNFSGASLFRSTLHQCDLRKVDFGSTNMTEADLRWSKLAGANLHDATVYGTRFEGVTGLSESQIFYLKNRGAIFNEEITAERTAVLSIKRRSA